MESTRRDFLRGSATTLIGACALAGCSRSFVRLAHFTDIHLYPLELAVGSLIKALHHVQSLPRRPDFIVQGGDAILDALDQPKEFVQNQWKLWHAIWQGECSLPVFQVLGNHDIYSWLNPKPDPSGKRWALDEMKLERGYYGFDRGGWRFLVLDSNFATPGGYEARLDPEQCRWLVQRLAETPIAMPVCVISHIPILSVCAYFDGENELRGDWRLPGRLVHLDARALKGLFRRYPNVKLCLSGHIHLQDEVDYLGVKYLCNGSVSGDVWRGNYQEFDPCYVLVDFFADGSFRFERVAYLKA